VLQFILPLFRIATASRLCSTPAGAPHFLIERIFADGDYQDPCAAAAAATGKWIVEIVKRNELHKFVVLPKRWIVERTFAGSAAIEASRAISNAMPQPSPHSSAWQ